MELPEDNDSYNGLDNLSHVVPPESVAKSKNTADDKKKKKKREGDRQLKVKDLGEAGAGDDDDIDGIIQQQRTKLGGEYSDAGSQFGKAKLKNVNVGESVDVKRQK